MLLFGSIAYIDLVPSCGAASSAEDGCACALDRNDQSRVVCRSKHMSSHAIFLPTKRGVLSRQFKVEYGVSNWEDLNYMHKDTTKGAKNKRTDKFVICEQAKERKKKKGDESSSRALTFFFQWSLLSTQKGHQPDSHE